LLENGVPMENIADIIKNLNSQGKSTILLAADASCKPCLRLRTGCE
jgi:hypothetical protein